MAEPGAILLATGPWPAEPWAAAICDTEPRRRLFVHPVAFDPAEVRYLLAWKPPAGLAGSLPNLRAIFSLGAGVDHLVFRDDLPDVPIARVVSSDLTQRMTEWVVLQVLMQHRRQRVYDRFQREHRWHELGGQPAAPEVRVGILGMGVLGRDAAKALQRLGFDVAGWSRRKASVSGVTCYAAADLDAFLARTDILVCLLPLTPATRGMLAMPLFRKLARDGALGRGPVLINAGRGKLQVEADLVAALRDGTLAGASLDVFEEEPLDPASPLWDFDNVVITPHVAAESAPAALVPGIIRQIRAFEAGEPLENVIDRAAFY